MPDRPVDDYFRDKPKPAPVVPKPPAPNLSPARRILFAANDPLLALKAPAKYGVALSADVGYAEFATAYTVDHLRGAGHRVYAWCDCRPLGEGTPPEFAKQLIIDLRLDGWIGQAESTDEATRAIAAGATVVVGNVNALTPEQRQLVIDGKLLFIAEDYWNVMPWSKPDWQNLPVAASCVGMYDASSESANGRFVPLADYKAAGRFSEGSGLFHVGGMRDEDWMQL